MADLLYGIVEPVSVSYPDANPPPAANDVFDRLLNVTLPNVLVFVDVLTVFGAAVVTVTDVWNSFETVATLGGVTFFGLVPRSKLLLKLPPYRPPCRNVAHLLTFVDANVDSRNAFGPMLTYFGSKRLKPFNGTSRESAESIHPSSELFELFTFALVNVLNFLSVLFVALPAKVQADESQ